MHLQETPEEALKRQFEDAAERLRVQRKLDALPAEERIIERLKMYMKEWRADIDARPVEAVNTTVGLQVLFFLLPSPFLSVCAPVNHNQTLSALRCSAHPHTASCFGHNVSWCISEIPPKCPRIGCCENAVFDSRRSANPQPLPSLCQACAKPVPSLCLAFVA